MGRFKEFLGIKDSATKAEVAERAAIRAWLCTWPEAHLHILGQAILSEKTCRLMRWASATDWRTQLIVAVEEDRRARRTIEALIAIDALSQDGERDLKYFEAHDVAPILERIAQEVQASY